MAERDVLRFYRRDEFGDLANRRQQRWSPTPDGLCHWCWHERRPDAPGQLYVWGYPSTVPATGRHPICYCEACADKAEAMNIVLIPWPLPLKLV